MRRLTLVAAVAAVAAAHPAYAHTGTGLTGGLMAGALHPVSGADHLLAMIGVGLWGSILGRPLLIALPILFPAMMAVGGVLGMLNVPAPPVEIGIALSVLVIGGVIAAAWRVPAPIAIILVAIFAAFHGYAHGQELPDAADPLGYSVGFVVVTGLLHVGGIVIGMIGSRPAGLLAVRGIGGAIAVSGAYFLFASVA